ncbi:MAG: amino acid ABC transporter permease [Alphaproteobacteria bacterium]|nr:amino acid ABC transporter permease [Alphaproteobacteria bacterium]
MTAETAPLPDLKPPSSTIGPIGWLRRNLFNSIPNTILTLLALWFLWQIVPALYDWLFVRSTVEAADSRVCRDAGGLCIAFLMEKHRLILFGLYPFEQHWRPLAAMCLFLALILATCNRRFWKPWLWLCWAMGLPAVGVLMWGGVLGLRYVGTEQWGGLPLTVFLAAFGMVFAFPLSILLALGRRSKMPAIQALCIGYIELIRGVPLISVLFMASVMFPLFLPTGVSIDKLLRTQVAFILFAAAYLAEVVRGGLQAIPRGQYEAADSLGLGYWQKTGLIVLPQALKLVIPPLVNVFIGIFKDTSLVVIIGLFDLMNAAKQALIDPNWRGLAVDVYVAVSVVYFVFCYGMSKYSQALEADFNKSHR